MKLFLASFLEPHNFGPGKLIGVANGSKPEHLTCDSVFPPLIPSKEISERYFNMSGNDPKNAASTFVKSFVQQLDDFYKSVVEAAEKQDKKPIDVLPFNDGDTLASWEREAYTNYRPLICDCLEKLGYEVELH